MASAQSRKRARVDDLSQELHSPNKKIKSGRKRHQPSNWPPQVWDKLSRVPLVRISLRELDRRNRTQLAPRAAPAPAPAVRTADLARFARHGGPDLRHLRGYPEPEGAVHTMASPSGRSTATGVTTKMRTRKTSAYNGAFEVLMIDYSIYPPDYDFTDDPNATTPQPNNLKEEREVLLRRRPSLDSSRFTEREFQSFKRSNKNATAEVTVERTVVPFIAGSSDIRNMNAGNLLFSNLEPIAGEDVVKPKPDFFDGANIMAIHKKIKDANEDGNLSKLIIPTNNAPVLPNFFMEMKGPKGNLLVAQRQAMHVGAIGARGMHALQNYGKKEPVYDGNTYTYSSTYCNGTLNLYVHHVAPPTVPGGQPKYYMTLVNGWLLLTTSQALREGITAFRNARDRARWYRDNFIEAANARAHQSD
ncbi:hypothetical protein QBC32DRAFT_224945, partial [Pseudoneurospora amorphoporcata]